jgi:hypothetical protein
MLVEASAAMLMLAVLTTVCLQFMWAVSDQRRQLFAHLTASQEAANLMERLSALKWDELTGDAAGKLQLSAEARKSLPEAHCELLVEGPSGDPPAKRIVVNVYWPSQPGGPEHRVRLTAWRYKS